MAEVVREIRHDSSGQPIMILKSKNDTLWKPREGALSMHRPKGSFAIRFIDIWKFSEAHNPDFVNTMKFTTVRLHQILDLGTPNMRKLAELAWLIEDGIEEMIKLPPPPEKKGQAIGEGGVWIGGKRHSFELRE